MLPLLHRFRRRGYKARVFRHFPWVGTLESKAAALRDCVPPVSDASSLHLIGHSLGGLIILRMLAGHVPKNLGRIVTMGTPHLGSAAVDRLSQHLFGRPLIGRALSDACHFAPLDLPASCELGTLAGKRTFCRLATALGHRSPNDTIVAAAEARHPSAVDHILLKTSHAGMLISRSVSNQVIHFLEKGQFRHS